MATKIPDPWSSRTKWFVFMLSTTMALVACTNDIRQISQNRFVDMVKSEEVSRISIVNNQWVEIHLKSDALLSSKYQAYFSDKMRHGEPQFQFRITSEQALRDDLAKLNSTFPITSEKRGLFVSDL